MICVQAKCSCDNGIKDGDVCRCPCEDSDTINELHLEVQARILHFTEAFKKESKYWEGDGAADGTAKAKTQKVVTSLEVVTDAHGVRCSIRAVNTFSRNEGLLWVPRSSVTSCWIRA